MSLVEVGNETGFKNHEGGKNLIGGPDKRTPKQVVEALNLKVGAGVLMPDGVIRSIRKINCNGEVFVRGMRGAVNPYALRPE